jgi:hypothetical protein
MKNKMIAVATVTLLGSLGTFSATAAQTAVPAGASIQISAGAAATEEIGHNAENLYDWGRQSNWTKARADLIALKNAVAKLEATGAVDGLDGAHRNVALIEAAVNQRRSRALMHSANEMTSVAAELSRQFKPQVPVEVTLLDYDAREIELWAEEGKLQQLHESRMRLKEGWTIARASVVAQGGITEARQFDTLVNQLTMARTPREFAAVATPILNSVDSLETVFTRGKV